MRAKAFFQALFLGICFSVNLSAQLYITGMQQVPSVYPQPVTVLVDLALPAAGCPHNPLQVSLSGNTLFASSTHCLGFLTTICYTTDTFVLQLPSPGQYHFVYNLSLGAFPPPCIPGALPPQTDSLIINYPDPLSLKEYLPPAEWNPSGNFLQLPDALKGATLEIFSLDGRLRHVSSSVTENQIPLRLTPGVYVLRAEKNNRYFHQKIVIQ